MRQRRKDRRGENDRPCVKEDPLRRTRSEAFDLPAGLESDLGPDRLGQGLQHLLVADEEHLDIRQARIDPLNRAYKLGLAVNEHCDRCFELAVLCRCHRFLYFMLSRVEKSSAARGDRRAQEAARAVRDRGLHGLADDLSDKHARAWAVLRFDGGPLPVIIMNALAGPTWRQWRPLEDFGDRESISYQDRTGTGGNLRQENRRQDATRRQRPGVKTTDVVS